MSVTKPRRGRPASGSALTDAQRQQRRRDRLAARTLTCMLSEAAAGALDRLTATGQSQSTVVSAALVAYLATR